MDNLILPSGNKCLICLCDYGTAGAEFERIVFKCDGCMGVWRTCWECKPIKEYHLPFVVKHQDMMRCINCAINKYKLYHQESVNDLYEDVRINDWFYNDSN